MGITIQTWTKDVPTWQHFYKPVADGCVAVLLVNHDNSTHPVSLYFSDVVGLDCDRQQGCHVVDVWRRRSMGSMTMFEANITSRDSVFLVLDSSGSSCPAPFKSA